jgi:four helix bundle protein
MEDCWSQMPTIKNFGELKAWQNIAEGFESGSEPEFVRFLKMARRSAAEVQSELYLALDVDYITEEERQKTHVLATEVKQLINGMTYLRKSD